MTKLLLVFSILLMNLCNLIALDIKKDVQGDQQKCAVIEPVRNFTFDFNEIVSELGYHINGDDDNLGQYFFNLCKPLSRKCKNQTVAACLIKHRSKEEVIIGYDSKLYWNDGQIRLSYVGEECKDKINFTLNVMLHCDYQNNKNDFLGVFHLEDQCEINIFMKTPKACLPVPDNIKSAKMFVKTLSNKTLNFNALKSSNHIAEKSSDGSFVIGFPILYSHDVMCEAGSTVCFINNTETDTKKKFKNVGMMTSDIKFENDHPVLVLTSDEECNGTKKYSSKITFICDKLLSDGSPRFMKENDCTYYFEWETKYACVDEKSCQISGPNGEFYDFSSLVGLQYSIPRSNKSNEVIHFSLCSPAKECVDENWGSCIIRTDENGNKQTTNIGFLNSKLQIDSKNVFLKYDGSKCNGKGDLFSTRIEFIVADEPKDEEVVLIEDKCEIVLHLKTLLVNQNVKNCVVKNRHDVEFDLRPLIDYNGNYEATIDTKESIDARYFINVCRPLNSKYSLDCHGNSAACRTVVKDGKHEEELSLGHFEYAMSTEPGKDGTTNVLMKYFHGSKCPEDNEEHITTTITFFCDILAGLGNPILKSTEHCEYSFDFPTNILCNEQHLTLKSSDSCELLNDKANKSINLKTFGIFESDNVKVDICDNVTKFYTLNYKDSLVVIEYASKDKDIQVQLKCGVKNNTKIDVDQNQILVMHETNLICPFLNIAPKMMEFVASPKSDTDEKTVIKDEQKKPDESSAGFSMGYIFLIICLIVAFGAFYLVIRHPERREIIMNMVKFRSRRNIRYARINLSEESALLTDNHDLIASDSDDENILL
ncbi:unnamed protein product [Chironomus riparius]|uniref:MRH domain-containing protein n=1 Tax=Chironomus riparius TaxID=315576 RepID=A0A9N9RWH7_9DIPT|nr:unnamed protein product [Chironomus riparius]